MRPPTKLQLFANLVRNRLSPSVLSRFISASLFSVPQVENEVKRTPLCGCCWEPRTDEPTDELKKAQKEKFTAAFQKLYDRANACIYANGAYFELKKKVCVFDFLKKTVLKPLDRTVYKNGTY
jgi:hypothetical protein